MSVDDSRHLDLGGTGYRWRRDPHDPRPGSPAPLVWAEHACWVVAHHARQEFGRWALLAEAEPMPAKAGYARRALNWRAVEEEWTC